MPLWTVFTISTASCLCLSGPGRVEAAGVTSVVTGGWDLYARLYSDLTCQTRASALVSTPPRWPDHLQHLLRSWSVRKSQPAWVSSQHSINTTTFRFIVSVWLLCHFSLWRLDSWLTAAVDCLDLFPDQLIVVASEQLIQQNAASGKEKHKRLLFDTIAKYYNSPERPPLLSGRYTDIQTGILHLLGKCTAQWIFGKLKVPVADCSLEWCNMCGLL